MAVILLIEDDAMVRDMCALMLAELGFLVIKAADGQEAVKLFQQNKNKITLVLCDMVMPRMDGWQTVAALRALDPSIQVILASGDYQGLTNKTYVEQPQAFMGKPYSIETLRKTINQVLHQEAATTDVS
jgi:CheY-like chemotaxis protein